MTSRKIMARTGRAVAQAQHTGAQRLAVKCQPLRCLQTESHGRGWPRRWRSLPLSAACRCARGRA